MDTTSQSPNHDNDSERRPPLSSSSIPECLEAEKNETEEWMELMGEDLLLKEIYGRKDAMPCEVGTCVLVDFVGRQASSKHDIRGTVFHAANDMLLVVGDKDCIPALEMGIRFLREGSKGLVYSHSKYAYGNLTRINGDYILPQNSNVMYEVHIKKIVHGAGEVEIASSRKKIANDCYKNEWNNGHGKSRPLYLYRKAAEAMDRVLIDSPDNEEARSILVDSLNNMAAVHLRAKDYGEAKNAATRVLMHDPDNVKALCRAARAAMLDPAGSYEESEAAISVAESVNASDPAVVKLRSELIRRKKEYKKKNKAAYSKLGVSEKKPKSRESAVMNEDQRNTAKDVRTTENTRGQDANETLYNARESQTWYDVWRPMLLQMMISLVALFVFQHYFKQTANSDKIKENLENDVDSASSEF
jgi:tetratricopeptide (TPR) repeat protein